MSHHQKFLPPTVTTALEEAPFEFKPLDLKAFGIGTGTKRKVRKRIPCKICYMPGCYLEIDVEEEQ